MLLLQINFDGSSGVQKLIIDGEEKTNNYTKTTGAGLTNTSNKIGIGQVFGMILQVINSKEVLLILGFGKQRGALRKFNLRWHQPLNQMRIYYLITS